MLTFLQKRDFTFNENDTEDTKPTLNTDYTGFSIYGRALCLVVDPPSETDDLTIPSMTRKRKVSQKGHAGIEDWFVNTRIEELGIDDS